MPPSTSREHHVFRLSGCCPPINACLVWHVIFILSGAILTNIHHVCSGHCWERSEGWRSDVIVRSWKLHLWCMISVHLVERFQQNLTQIFTMWVGIAEIFSVRGQKSRSWWCQMHFSISLDSHQLMVVCPLYATDIQINSVALRLTCVFFLKFAVVWFVDCVMCEQEDKSLGLSSSTGSTSTDRYSVC